MAGPLTCEVTGAAVDSVAVLECSGPIPTGISEIECTLDGVTTINCEDFTVQPFNINICDSCHF